MRWRRLSEEEIEGCITAPEASEESPSGIVNCWKVIRGQWLRTVYLRGNDTIIVVTVIYPARGPRGEST